MVLGVSSFGVLVMVWSRVAGNLNCTSTDERSETLSSNSILRLGLTSNELNILLGVSSSASVRKCQPSYVTTPLFDILEKGSCVTFFFFFGFLKPLVTESLYNF